jgi:Domain of unknown function (DUF4292)
MISIKNIVMAAGLVAVIASATQCRTTKKISKAIAPKDTTVAVVITKESSADSLLMIQKTLANLGKSRINYTTFTAKIKVDYEDSKGKQPDVNAYVRIIKDSLIWINIRSAFLDIDAFRILITKDSVFVVNKLNKEVQFRSIDYLQEVTEIPFDYKTVQDMIVGNPIFADTAHVVSYKKNENNILIALAGDVFKHLLTLDTAGTTLIHSKLDDLDVSRNRTADITYGDFETKSGQVFSTKRQITVAEKNKLDIRMNYKQYEFNKELSISFSIPKNYKRT